MAITNDFVLRFCARCFPSGEMTTGVLDLCEVLGITSREALRLCGSAWDAFSDLYHDLTTYDFGSSIRSWREIDVEQTCFVLAVYWDSIFDEDGNPRTMGSHDKLVVL